MRTFLSTACVILACAFATSSAIGQGSAGTPTLSSETLAELLEELRAKHDVPALAAGIFTKDGPVMIEVVGVRKRGTPRKAQKTDMFHLGSCTKPFTGWLAGWAVEQGHLRWDSTIAEVFPREARRWPDAHKKITLEQLLTHRSGIYGDLPKGFDHWPRQTRVQPQGHETRKQRLELVEALGSLTLRSEPGSEEHYCNTNQIVAAAMVEETVGKPWENLLEELLFRPLGIEAVGQGPMGRPGRVDQPWQHTETGEPMDPVPQADNPEVMGPAGRLHMSLESWGKFAVEILRGSEGRGKLLKPETYQALLRAPQGFTKGCWATEGVDESGAPSVLSHSGSNNANVAGARIYPREGFAVFVATNQGATGVETPGSKVCHELMNRLIELWHARLAQGA